jgi:hypothetical protein
MHCKIPFQLFALCFLPFGSYAGGHGFGHGGNHCHGSHSHMGGHVGGHYGGHHYTYHSTHLVYSNRTSGYRTTDAGLTDPLKGAQELTTSGGAISGWDISDQSTSTTPPISLGYHYFVSGGFAIGLSGGVQTLSGKDNCNCNTSTPDPYSYQLTAVTVAADFKWLYASRNDLQVYGGVALGVTRYSERDHYLDKPDVTVTGYQLNGQFTALGVRYGKALGGFVELGYGYRGLVCAGISYELNYHSIR